MFGVNVKDNDWVGNIKIVQERNHEREIYRFAAHLAVENTVFRNGYRISTHLNNRSPKTYS
jgi:hypothetical protein